MTKSLPNLPHSEETLRFVLLHHVSSDRFEDLTGRGDHFDLMIERPQQDQLASWAFEENPLENLTQTQEQSGQRVLVRGLRVADHRKAYLTYQGPVANDRGEVKRVIAGSCIWREHSTERSIVTLSWEHHRVEATIEPLQDDHVMMSLVVNSLI